MPFTLLLTGALIASPAAADLLRHANAPHLRRLLARGRVRRRAHDPFAARCTAEEAWLAQQFGLPLPFPRAHCFLHRHESAETGGGTHPAWCMELCHFHLATDHLVLADPSRMAIGPDESEALLESAGPLLQDEGIDVRPLTPAQWLLHLPAHWEVRCATPACAIGRNVEAWMPAGAQARDWRRILNGLQMLWHEHPVNLVRTDRGLPAINSAWLHGGTSPTPRKAFQSIATDGDDCLSGLAAWSGAPEGGQTPVDGLLAVDRSLQRAAQEEDWAAWLQAVEAVDRGWLGPALAARAQSGTIRVVLTGESEWVEAEARASDSWAFWRRGNGWDVLVEHAA